MSRQDANAAFARTSFLYGTNAALHRRALRPLRERPGRRRRRMARILPEPEGRRAPSVAREARGALLAEAELADPAQRRSGRGARRPVGRDREGDRRQDLGQGAGQGRRAVPDRRHAGHARYHPRTDADPRLPHARPFPRQSRSARDPGDGPNEEELDPTSYGFTEADMDRPIFLDMVLGLEFATMREILAILRRTYCQTLGVEFMHISNPAQKAWIQERIEGHDKEITFTREGKRAILNKLVEAEGFEKFLDVKYTGTKRFGLDGAESLIPAHGADHQARRQSRRKGNLHRHAAPRPPERADAGDGQAAPRAVPRVQGRLVDARRDRRLRRREVPSRRLVRSRVRRQQGAPVAHRQPVASGDRRSGDARQGARQAGPARRHAGRAHAW